MEIKEGAMSEAEEQTNSTDIEREIIAAYYFLFKEGLPRIKDEGEAGFKIVSEEIKTRFPQFSKMVRFEYDKASVEQQREEIRNILRGLPREKIIWVEEFRIRIRDALDLAYNALNRNMRDIFEEDFPRPLGETNSRKAFWRLDKKFSELTANKQSLSWEMGEKYIRSYMEVAYAWDVVLLTSAFMGLYRESSTNPRELFCLMNQLGQSCGLLKTLAEDYNNLLKEAHNRIKQSKNAQKSRTNALMNLTIEIMKKTPKIKEQELLDIFRKEAVDSDDCEEIKEGVISTVTDEVIEWTDYRNKIRKTPITGLKDLMSRARKKILSH